jgi:excisionase family DNA binding protein
MEPIFVTVNEAKRLLAIGHTRVYELMASGDLERVKCGGKTLISVESIRKFAQKLLDA